MPEATTQRPILFLDVDGVISLFGFPSRGTPPGQFHWVDGIAHCISDGAGARLILGRYRLERLLLDLPDDELPVLTFDGRAVFGTAHWKLGAIDEYAGDRAAAWIDDSLDERCTTWADERPAPTLLVETDSATGITDEHVERLLGWALAL